MKFQVRFITEWRCYVASGDGKRPGLRLIQAARDLVPGIEDSKIAGYIPWASWYNVNLDVPEQLAWSAYAAKKLFWEDGEVKVRVPPYSLNKYVEVKLKQDGECVEFKYEISDKVVQDWAAAGFPTEWDPQQELEPAPSLEPETASEV
jgi:hypothetical protein